MKLTVLQINLNKAVSQAVKIIGQKNQLPILSNLLLQAKNNRFTITATNLEIGLTAEVPAKIEQEGEITVSGKTLNELVSLSKTDKLVLSTEKELLILKYPGGLCQIKGTEAGEYPPMPGADKHGGVWQIKAGVFNNLCQSVLLAASTDESRPALSGVKMIMLKGKIQVIATDGYRLSQKIVLSKTDKEAEILVPAQALKELVRIIQEEDEIKFSLDDNKNQLVFIIDKTVLTARLIGAEFPLIDKVIPKNWQTEVLVDREELIAALKTSSVFARESANIVKFAISPEGLSLSANAALVGENRTEIEARVSGPEVEVAFNFRFVLEFLNSIKEEQVLLRLGDSLSPAIFQPKNDPDLLHVIMPVRVAQES